ncbi:hypothetical protein M8J77_002120 [Diaphorina citri]|nr:hypothetical protein M8J77_002120 [Diaphorina citri]
MQCADSVDIDRRRRLCVDTALDVGTWALFQEPSCTSHLISTRRNNVTLRVAAPAIVLFGDDKITYIGGDAKTTEISEDAKI